MYGQQPPLFHFSGNVQPLPPPQPQFNNLYSNNNYCYPLPFPFVNPNVPISNPSFNFDSQISNKTVIEHNRTMKKISKAVSQAHKNIINAGEHVSVVKVVQDVISMLKVDSWDSLGIKIQNVPFLHHLMQLERKINTFISCFVEVWEIITLYDLETAICKNEGVKEFEELELGPLIRHPLVNLYFSISSVTTEVFKISGEEIVNFLVKFMDTHKGEQVEADDLLNFIAKKRSVDSRENLHVRIHSLGLHLSLINQARSLDISKLKEHCECIKSFYSGYGDDISSNDNKGETFLTNQSIHSSQKNIKKSIKKRKSDLNRSLDRLTCEESVIKKSNKKRKSDCTSHADGDMKMKKCEVVNAIGRKKGFKQQTFICNDGDESACIMRDEFKLVSDISTKTDSIMKKQHHISKESNFLLELVKNADDNVYPCDVEPTLAFILQEDSVIVLNNDLGFSVENINALFHGRDLTEKDPNDGFKSLFQVTDAPEIHSNRFHIRFDISGSQLGFVLPTIVPPCDVSLFSKMLVSLDNNPTDNQDWETCIMLPFKSKKKKAFVVKNLISMFSKFHPSSLIFLHRLKCIMFKYLFNDSLTVMRKQIVGGGIVNVFLGEEKTTWFVKSHKLNARYDVQKSTDISIAFMLEEDANNGYFIPKLEQQDVFIIHADFVLSSSSCEEVDVNSPWNQWLLSEFPNLFVDAEISFCSLPCFEKNLAKGISVFMSFVPLEGEVDGFFSCLPNMIVSRLCSSNCLLLEGNENEWVPPCKVLRNWTEEIRSLLPDSLIMEHIGVGYLNKDTVLTDSLAQALHIEECGLNIIFKVLTSLCLSGSIKSMGISWLSSCFNVLYLMLANETDYEYIISSLRKLPIIPLLNGNYVSVNEGTIWLHTDIEPGYEDFKKLYSKLRVVDPAILDCHVENVTEMLHNFGIQKLSNHELIKGHILPAICDEKVMSESNELIIEYLSFIMFHLESELSCCSECVLEKEDILSQLSNRAYILTNHGYKRLVDVPIHFGKEFGNPIDMSKLVFGTDIKWFEIDIRYLNHPACKSLLTWRNFLMKLGVTDFVQIVEVEKGVEWYSQELMHLMAHVSLNRYKDKSKYLLKVFDELWDDYFSDKPFKSYVLNLLHAVPWLESTIDDQLHLPKDLFHSCKTVRKVLGDRAPYAVHKVKNVNFLNAIRFKNTITLDDALSLLDVWIRSEKSFQARITEMSEFYTYIWNEMRISKQKIFENLHSRAFIFVPHSFGSTKQQMVSGLFLSPSQVYWHDSVSDSMEQTKSTDPHFDEYMTNCLFNKKTLSNVYPRLHDFFVNNFGVADNPPLLSYLQSLIELSTGSLPSQAAKTVFQVFRKWSHGLDLGVLSCDDINYLKARIEEIDTKILPTMQDKWVSLHQSFGFICWCDNEQLQNEFKNKSNVHFLCFGELNTQEKQILHDKISVLFRELGIPSLSEVVTREAVYDGLMDDNYIASLINWALPYAQRYIYTIFPNIYLEFKSSGFKNIRCLKLVVVQTLVYMNVIKKHGIESNERFKCSCLVQDNILYTTYKSDSHSIFSEISRFLLPEFPEPLSNFLDMITTMAESGSVNPQMDFFITDTQKLLYLPHEDPQWCLASSSFKTRLDVNVTERLIKKDGDWIMTSSTELLTIDEEDEEASKEDVSIGPKHVVTGRTGEVVAFKYFCAKIGKDYVKWVNEFNESGLPYDIVIEGEDDDSKEYIEVKATSHEGKDWFGISVREWQFGVEKGDSFSIARVVVSDDTRSAQITTYRNPAKLCQLKQLHLQLALQPPKQ